jgi:rhodanese-related sulfurtransferase
MQSQLISPQEAKARIARGDGILIDIREADEFAREAIPGARNAPMSALATCDCPADQPLIFHCKSGMRTKMAAPQLAEWAGRDIAILDGGIEAWRGAGFATKADRSKPLEIMRQVQITAGGLTLAGAVAALTLHPAFVWIPVVTGAGLLFAGLSGTCMMANVLMRMPWNKRATA